MKTEVYSWRVSAELKSSLEREARRRKVSLSAVLDLAARELLERTGEIAPGEEQLRLHRAAAECFGAFGGGDPDRSTRVRQSVRARLQQRDDGRRTR